MRFTALFILLYLPCFFILVTNDEFAAYYGKVSGRGTDWWVFGRARLQAVASLSRTELFYRGFLLFGLRKSFKDHEAKLIHLIPYGIAHIGKPELECVGSLLVGYFLGYLSLRTRSIWYGVFLHWFFASSFTIYYLRIA